MKGTLATLPHTFQPPHFTPHLQVRTSVAMWKYGPGYGKWGLMVGSVFVKIMEDVESEGWKEVRQQWQEEKCGEVWDRQ